MDSDLQILQRVLQAATEGMSEKQLEWHPEGKWSTAEVLEHLYLTYTGTIKGFERMVGAGKPLATDVSIKQRIQTLVVFAFSYLPSGRKAPAQAVPRGLAAEQVRTEMQGKIAAMDEIIEECKQRFGTGPLLDHPILGPLTAKQWSRFHLIHGRHHAKQIARLRQQMGEGANLSEIHRD
jgi:hypothetical protein